MTISWSVLRDARTAKGWTQKELAEHIDVHQKTVVNWEREGNAVSAKSEYRVRRALGAYLDYAEYLDGMPDGAPRVPPEEWAVYQEIEETRRQRDRMMAIEREATAAADARAAELAIPRRLSDFPTADLLGEVQRRVRSDGSIAAGPEAVIGRPIVRLGHDVGANDQDLAEAAYETPYDYSEDTDDKYTE